MGLAKSHVRVSERWQRHEAEGVREKKNRRRGSERDEEMESVGNVKRERERERGREKEID